MGVAPVPDDVLEIAARFTIAGPVTAAVPIPGGHINDTYRVEARRQNGTSQQTLLQRINARVFPRPDWVMENVSRVVRRLTRRDPRYPALVPTREGGDWLTDAAGGVWRMFTFVPGTTVRDRVRSPADAHAAGRGFGEFLRLLADDPPPLHETIHGFHDTIGRFARLEAIWEADPHRRAAGAAAEMDDVRAARPLADVLPPLLASGALPPRVVHNDAKIANVLLARASGEPVCVIDLDTVMSGTALFDFGDLVRSCTSPTAEDTEDLASVAVRSDLFEALARGYLGAAGPVLTRAEVELLVLAGRLITVEQAVRFLTDHLDGDRYYRVERPDHNLVRCRTQLALFRSLTAKAGPLERLIAACLGKVPGLA